MKIVYGLDRHTLRKELFFSNILRSVKAAELVKSSKEPVMLSTAGKLQVTLVEPASI